MPWIAALALVLAASLAGGCNQKDRSPAPAADPAAGSQAAPAATPAPADPTPAPAAATGPEIPAAESLRRIIDVVDKVCACPDRACADTANAELAEQNRKLAGRPHGKPTPAEAEAMQAQAKRLAGCVQRLP
ncbi:MAG TPA: hypothetical protein VK932_23405 [Kofleriaceae bacterium]|nr:hypothetical protein [Kofleriaceae bacterium]